ncbi:MAG: site-2 protease family protein [Fidelibacterota bacterium]
MLFRLPIEVLVLLLPTLLFALCFHEFSHAYMAYRLGDDTAARMGRLTLNPLAHIDPMGALMILFVGFGWAKPVPVNPFNLRNMRVDMMKVAFAGPLSNLFLAFVGGLIIRFMGYTTDYELYRGGTFSLILYFFVQINIMLAVFNMIPLSPLDGSRIFSGFLEKKYPDLVHNMNIYGPRILMGIIFIGILTNVHIFGMIIRPFLKLFMYIFAGVH